MALPTTLPWLRHALDVARSAPSAHNTQPWSVDVAGDTLVVRADPARRLAHGDPAGRDLRLGLGAFVEAFVIAAGAEGVGVDVDAAPGSGVFAVLRASGRAPNGRGEDRSLLRQRQTSRLAYSPRAPDGGALERVAAAARDHGMRVCWIPRGSANRAEIDRWFYAAAREAWLDPRATAELVRWLRFDPEGSRAPQDGLSTHCLNLDVVAGTAFMGLAQPALWRLAGRIGAAPALAAAMARSEAAAVVRTPVVGVLVRDRDAAMPGRSLLRVWLAATRERLAMHPISVLLDRRGWELARHLGVRPEMLLFAFRLGHSAPPPRSQRLPVEAFARPSKSALAP